MEVIRNVGKWGNSAGVLLPREWLGSRVKIEIVEDGKDIKKEILGMLEPYLEDLLGVYLTGSHARGEQEDDSDVDIIAISKSIKKEIISGRYRISIAPLESIRKSLKSNPILILPRIMEAKVILNRQLLDELSLKNLSAKDFLGYFKETKRIMSINKEFIKLDKEDSQNLESEGVIYSLILRLRGMYIIGSLLEKKVYSKKGFLRFLENGLSKKDVLLVYSLYKKIRDNIKTGRRNIKIKTAQKLMDLLSTEVNKYDK